MSNHATFAQWRRAFFLLTIILPYHECFILHKQSFCCKANIHPRKTKISLSAKQSRNNNNKRTRRGKLRPLEYERSLQERGYSYVIGTDEVGRGSIAGPVVAVSCCVMNNHNHLDVITTTRDGRQKTEEVEKFHPIDLVADSKLLTPHQRKAIYDQIHNQDDDVTNKYYKYCISQRSPEQIQETNILKATMECFQESIQNLILDEKLPLDQTYAVVDGKSTPKLVNGPTPIPCRPYVSADKDIYSVSIASIIAKVIRDDIMIQASELYPEYNFHLNKGYSSKEHIEAIHKYGPCPLHRMSFKPLQHR
jgi:ribonuclease HII